mmetsp:Transcript_40543/g.52215  ORF Transcript_40543/g.52215 Transcript_40543/m.52215 type:complete len:247 (-) Transcript_40543:255-995(-)
MIQTNTEIEQIGISKENDESITSSLENTTNIPIPNASLMVDIVNSKGLKTLSNNLDRVLISQSKSLNNSSSKESSNLTIVEDRSADGQGANQSMHCEIIPKIINNRNDDQNKDAIKLNTLILRQKKLCPKILIELKKYNKKRTHWAWWIFPTEKEGMSEPLPRTSISKENAHQLLEKAPIEWSQCLELIVTLAKNDKKKGLRGILPEIDLPRVRYFIKFWSNIPNIPDWLTSVLKGLELALVKVKR